MGYYVKKVLTSLSEWERERLSRNFGQLIVHADSAHSHKTAVS
jgi:hypothetical protein